MPPITVFNADGATCLSCQRDAITIQETPNRSTSMPNLSAKKVFASGIFATLAYPDTHP